MKNLSPSISASRNHIETLDAEECKQSFKHQRNGTIASGYTVMAKAMIGSGILTISFTCAQSGIILGIFMLLFAAALTWLSLHVLSKLSLSYPQDEITFYLMNSTIFPRFSWFYDVALLFDCVGAAICFIQVTGSHLAVGIAAISGTESISVRNLTIVLECAVVIGLFPLTMLKEVTATKYLNLLGIACLIYLAALAIAYTDISAVSSALLYPVNAVKALSTFPIIILALGCQQNLLDVTNEMKNPTLKRFDIVTGSAVLTGIIIYLPVMLLPVLSYGRPAKIPDTFVGLLNLTEVPVIIGYFAAAVVVGTSYILIVRPIRSSTISLVYGNDRPPSDKDFKLRLILTLGISAVVLGAAIGVGDHLSIALSFTGLLGANTCGFVMPFAMYLGRFGWKPDSPLKAIVLALLIFCVLLYPVGITANILDIIES